MDSASWQNLLIQIVRDGESSPITDSKYPLEYLSKCADMNIYRPFKRKRLDSLKIQKEDLKKLASLMEEFFSGNNVGSSFKTVMADYLSYYTDYRSKAEIDLDIKEIKAEIEILKIRQKKYPEIADLAAEKIIRKVDLISYLTNQKKNIHPGTAKAHDKSTVRFFARNSLFFKTFAKNKISVKNIVEVMNMDASDFSGKEPEKFGADTAFVAALIKTFKLVGSNSKKISVTDYREIIKSKAAFKNLEYEPAVIGAWLDYEKYFEQYYTDRL